MRLGTCVAPGILFIVSAAAQAQQVAQVSEPALRLELLERTKKDQAARNVMIEWEKEHGALSGTIRLANPTPQQQALIKLVQAIVEVDEEHTKWLKELVAKQGWPTISLVGNDGAHAAWLLVQHADREPTFQRKCLDLMTELPKDEVARRDLAYLTDRVLLKEGKKQLYGTQFTSDDGKWKPQPLDDEANVDARRAEVGLPPIAEYARQLEEVYGAAPSK